MFNKITTSTLCTLAFIGAAVGLSAMSNDTKAVEKNSTAAVKEDTGDVMARNSATRIHNKTIALQQSLKLSDRQISAIKLAAGHMAKTVSSENSNFQKVIDDQNARNLNDQEYNITKMASTPGSATAKALGLNVKDAQLVIAIEKAYQKDMSDKQKEQERQFQLNSENSKSTANCEQQKYEARQAAVKASMTKGKTQNEAIAENVGMGFGTCG